MTRENAKALLPTIEAYANGETIQFLARGKDIWEDLDHPSFLAGENYRIKPKPREWWIVGDTHFRNVHQVMGWSANHNGAEIFHVIEAP